MDATRTSVLQKVLLTLLAAIFIFGLSPIGGGYAFGEEVATGGGDPGTPPTPTMLTTAGEDDAGNGQAAQTPLSLGTQANEVTVTIGDGTDAPTGTYSRLPFSCFYKNSVSETVYLASEMVTDDGNEVVDKSTITGLKYYVGANKSVAYSSLEIYLGYTNSTDASSVVTPTDPKLVYSSTSGNIASETGWETYTFNTGNEFQFDASKGNLVVLVIRNGSSYSNNSGYRVTSSPTNKARYWRDDSQSVSGYDDALGKLGASGDADGNRPNIQFVMDVAAGPDFTTSPSGFTYKTGTTQSETLTAVAESETAVTSYQWYSSSNGEIPDAESLVAAATNDAPTATALGIAQAGTESGGAYTFTYTPTAEELAAGAPKTVYYYCLATNADGSTISSPAEVQVYTEDAPAPTGTLAITSNPAATGDSLTVAEADAVILTATGITAATGDTLHYQWYAKGESDTGFAAIEGATENTYEFNALKGSAQYKVKAWASHQVAGNVSDQVESAAFSVTGNVKTISNPDQLADFAARVNGTAPYTSADDFAGRTVLLAGNLDLSSFDNWTPIGTDDHRFKGTFDGQGHSISNLNISSTTGGTGLFGYVQGATIKDLVIESGTVTSSSYATGAVVGQASGNTTITGVGNNATVSGTGTNGNYVGGVVGRVFVSGSALAMSSCYNKGAVSSASASSVGGLIGYANSNSTTIVSCYNLGAVSATGYVAGISGRYGTVKNCVNAGTVTVSGSSTSHGPILGDGGSKISAEPNYWLEGSDASYTPSFLDPDVSVTSGQLAGTEEVGEEGSKQPLLTLLNSEYAGTWLSGAMKSPAQASPILAWEYTPGMPSITTQPASHEYDYGEAQENLTIVAAAPDAGLEGADGTLSFQWFKNTTGEPNPATDTQLTATSSTATSSELAPGVQPGSIEYFYCTVTNTYEGNAEGVTAISNVAKVQVHSNIPVATPVVTLSTEAEQTIETGGTATITASAAGTPTEGLGTLSYKWYKADSATIDPANDVEVTAGITTNAEAKTSTLQATANEIGSAYYYCVVTNTFEETKTAKGTSPVTTVTAEAAKIASGADWTNKVVTPLANGNALEGCVFKLTADIDVNAVAGSNATRFKGELDGGGHTITLSLSGASDQGLFAYVEDAHIHDLVLAGTVTATGNYTAALAAEAYGSTLIECVGNTAAITNTGSRTQNIGGIVGQSQTTDVQIKGCCNKGNITVAYRSVGGILGGGSATILSCYNAGAVTTSYRPDFSTSDNNIGGIAGNLSVGAIVSNCVNTGTVSSPNISNSYGAAAIAGSSTPTGSSEDKANYWLAGSAPRGSAYTSSYTSTYNISKTADEMKALASTLNVSSAANSADTWFDGADLIAQDSPILWWEYPHGKPIVTMKTDDARVAAGTTKDIEIEVSVEEEYTGTLTYIWYANADGDTSAREADKIAGAPNAATYQLAVTGADATYYYCTVSNAMEGGTTYVTASPAVKIQAYDKDPAVPVVSVTPAQQNPVMQLGLGQELTAAVTYAADDQGGIGEVTYQWQELVGSDWADIAGATASTHTPVIKNIDDNSFRCVVANAYAGMNETGTSGSVVITGVPKTISSAEELADFAASVNGTGAYEGMASTYEGATVKLTADIDLQDLDADATDDDPYLWAPIGTSGNRFKGTFDGGGYTISGLKIDSSAGDQALFGYVQGATIENLIVQGQVETSSSHASGVIACASGSTTVTNVGNEAAVTAASNYAGGVVGYVGSGTGTHVLTISNSYNKGAITSRSGYAGGLVGYSTANSTFTSCYNLGDVTAANNFGGIAARNGKFYNCVNAGHVYRTGTSSYNYYSPIAYLGTFSSDDPNYAVSSLFDPEFEYTDSIISITAAQLAGTEEIGEGESASTLLALLNGKHAGAWKEGDANPILVWEAEETPVDPTIVNATVAVESVNSTVEAPIVLTPASITVAEKADSTKTVTPGATGAYALTIGTEYTVTIEAPTGYQADPEADPAQSLTQDVTAAADMGPISFALTPVRYGITYNLDGGEVDPETPNPASYTIEDDAITLVNPTKPSDDTYAYMFAGWTGTDLTEATTSVTIPTGSTGERSYTATWTAVELDNADQAAVDAAVTAINGAFALRPRYANGDTNINEFVKSVLQGKGIDTEGLTIAVASTRDVNYIALDGTITYKKIELGSTPNDIVNNATSFTVTKGEASGTTNEGNVTIGWDQAWWKAGMEAEAESVTWDTIKGENESASEVTRDLVLPADGSTNAGVSYSKITWASSNPDVIAIGESNPIDLFHTYPGVVSQPAVDTPVTLTATFGVQSSKWNSYVESVNEIEPFTKTFEVTVKGDGHVPLTETQLGELLDKYYIPAIKYHDDFGGASIESGNVIDGDISLPRYTTIKYANDEDKAAYPNYLDANPSKLIVFNNGEISVTSGDPAITINGYRGNVDRFCGQNKDVALTITITREGVTATRTVTFTVDAITDIELDEEIALMDYAKAHYWDAINDERYVDQYRVTGNLHAFQEINKDSDGGLSVAYDSNDKTGQGIIPDSYWGEGQSEQMEASGYNRFKSSSPSVIQHENLVVTQPAAGSDNARVTVTSWLSSAKYGKFAPAHPENAKLQQLYKQEVSQQVTVLAVGASTDDVAPTIADQTILVRAGEDFAELIAATGLPAPTMALAAGSTLPAGVVLGEDGMLSGVLGTAGTEYTFDVVATNALGSSEPATVTLKVVPKYETLEGTAYITVTDNGEFMEAGGINPAQADIMDYVPLDLAEVSKVDLDECGLGAANRDLDGDGSYDITVVHAFAYANQQYCDDGLEGLEMASSDSGVWLNKFMGMAYNGNFTYSIDGMSTMDYADVVPLADGMDIGVYGFNYNKWSDPKNLDHYFIDAAGKVQHAAAGKAYKTSEFTLRQVGFDMTGATTSPAANYAVSYGKTFGEPEGTVTTDAQGKVSITFPSDGTYYVWADGEYGTSEGLTDKIVSTPARVTVTVAPSPKYNPAEGTVYFSFSEDNEFYVSDGNVSGKQMWHVAADLGDVAAVDLDDLGYGQYKIPAAPDADYGYEVSGLQLLLYMSQNYASDTSFVPLSTSSPHHLYIKKFFGSTGDFMYVYNGILPYDSTLPEGTMATVDTLALKDGDSIDMVTLTDELYIACDNGIHEFVDDDGAAVYEYEAIAGLPLSVSLVRAGLGGYSMEYPNGRMLVVPESGEDGDGYEVYFGNPGDPDNPFELTDEDGKAEYTFNEPGEYYVWVDGGYDDDYECGYSTPAMAKVTVKAQEAPAVTTTELRVRANEDLADQGAVIEATGTPEPTLSISDRGTLPGDIAMDTGGFLTGSFAETGTYTFTVQASSAANSVDNAVTKEITITVIPKYNVVSEGEVYLTVALDDAFVNSSGTITDTLLDYTPVKLSDLSAIDLDDEAYGLGALKRDIDGDGSYEITVMHLIAYAHANFAPNGMGDFAGFDNDGFLWINTFFGQDASALIYGVGKVPCFAADLTVLNDGDEVWFYNPGSPNAWNDTASYGAHYFVDGEGSILHKAQAKAESPFSAELDRAGYMPDGHAPEAVYTVSYGKTYGSAMDTVTTGDDGVFEITFPSGGTWWVWADAGKGGVDGLENANVSGPARFTVEVAVNSDGLKDAIAAAKADKDATKVSANGKELPAGTEYATTAAAKALDDAIAAAQKVADAADAGKASQSDIKAATNKIAAAQKAFDSAKKKAAANKAALNSAIAAAKAAEAGVPTNGAGLDKGAAYTTPAAKKALDDAIAAAQKVAANAKASQNDVDAATAAIAAATAAFNMSKKSAKGEWERLAGDSRYTTMSTIVTEGFDKSSWAVIASGENFPDALAASALAGAKNAPVILTAKGQLSTEAAAQLRRLGVSKAYIMGGEAAVTKDVENAVKALGIKTSRVAGASRQETSVKAMQQVKGLSDTVIVATGNGFADTLSIAPWSYATKSPIVLTQGDGTLSADEAAAIKAAGYKKFVVVGGTAVVSPQAESSLRGAGLTRTARLAGADRYATSKAIADWALKNGLTAQRPAIATGTNFPDALAGAAVQGKNASVMVLVADANSAGVSTLAASKAQVKHGYVLGGPAVVADAVATAVAKKTDMAFVK